MAEKITKNYKVSAQGTLYVDGDAITISIEDKGDFNLAQLLSDFDGKAVKLSVAYDEDYDEPESHIDENTGEII